MSWRELKMQTQRQNGASRHLRWKKNQFQNNRRETQPLPGSRSRSKTAQDLSGLSGFPARFERF